MIPENATRDELAAALDIVLAALNRLARNPDLVTRHGSNIVEQARSRAYAALGDGRATVQP